MINDIFKYAGQDSKFADFGKKISAVFEHIVDRKSREVFCNSLLYGLTKDLRFVRDNVLLTEQGQKIYKKLKQDNQPLVIFGAGARGKMLLNMFPELNWQGFADNNIRGEYKNLSIVSLADALELWRDALHIISILRGYDSIEEKYGGGTVYHSRKTKSTVGRKAIY